MLDPESVISVVKLEIPEGVVRDGKKKFDCRWVLVGLGFKFWHDSSMLLMPAQLAH